MSEAAFVFPITPSTPMAEMSEAWAAAGKQNIFGTGMNVVQMESETGAAGVTTRSATLALSPSQSGTQ